MPKSPAPSAEDKMSATCKRTLDGMQPRCKQTPPGLGLDIDEGHLQAPIGSQERSGITARTAAQNDQLAFGHDFS